MSDFGTAQGLAGLIGEGINASTGNSIILLALFVVGAVALVMWYRRATMQETYLILFFILGILRVYSDNSAFADKGIFGFIHNLFLIASAFAFAKLVTSGTNR